MEDEDMMIDDGSGKPERDIPKVFDASCKGSRFLARESFDRITPMEMIHHALVSGALPETFERLLCLQERFEAGQAMKDFNNAMAAAKQEIPIIQKSKKGHGYRYEGLDDIERVVVPILAKYGLFYNWDLSNDSETIRVTCRLSHREGHVEKYTLIAPIGCVSNKLQNSLQAMGSAITYLQRYTIKAALGLSSSDDDGASVIREMSPIDERQFNELHNLIDDTGSDMRRLCGYFGISALSDLPGSRFDEALSLLKAKRRKASVRSDFSDKAHKIEPHRGEIVA